MDRHVGRLLAGILVWLGWAGVLCPQTVTHPSRLASTPRPEPVAETRLLMEAINQANFKGLERLLLQKPEGAEAWTFARGQALLIAEAGNLLMLRPPRTEGRATWLERSADLRASATRLGRAVADQDYGRSRANLFALAKSCNQCHQTFGVPTRITPFGAPPANPAPAAP
jgi:hypothetical protein